MKCPVCPDNELTFEHMSLEGARHIPAVEPHLLYIQEHANELYAFQIAENMLKDPQLAIGNETSLTAFIASIIKSTGFINRLRVGTQRQREDEFSVDGPALEKACFCAIPYKTRIHVIDDTDPEGTICACCKKQEDPGFATNAHMDRNCGQYIPFDMWKICLDCRELILNEPTVTITKTFTFAAAHHLPGHERLCQYTHGHEWLLELSVMAPVNPVTKMVMDFSDLKAIVNEHIVDVLDHNYINEFIWNPTAENICSWIFTRLVDGGLKGIHSVKLWEAPDSYAYMDKYHFVAYDQLV